MPTTLLHRKRPFSVDPPADVAGTVSALITPWSHGADITPGRADSSISWPPERLDGPPWL